ncbi:hypothetical protein ZWY2020_058560 [Hordeum vulgare]|nr:hypothetical protein ZWY2020_058560 [Hordeum vulgare]
MCGRLPHPPVPFDLRSARRLSSSPVPLRVTPTPSSPAAGPLSCPPRWVRTRASPCLRGGLRLALPLHAGQFKHAPRRTVLPFARADPRPALLHAVPAPSGRLRPRSSSRAPVCIPWMHSSPPTAYVISARAFSSDSVLNPTSRVPPRCVSL